MKLGLFYNNRHTDHNNISASHWIRILQMLPTYKNLGIDVSFNNPFRKYDAVILFRKSKKKYYFILLLLKLISKKVYFDTCIDIFDLNEEITPQKLKYAYKIAKEADGLICASHQIAEYAKPYTKSTFVMEDPINLDIFRFIKKNINYENPVFGWSGIPHKAIFLNNFAAHISDKIILITSEAISNINLNFNYKYIKWNYSDFPEDLLKCDIAILPRLLDNKYNNCHSSFKALVFAVSGIPIIANKIPSYVQLKRMYDGIVFLEDFENDISLCIEKLKTCSLDTAKIREHYSRENQAQSLIKYLQTNNILSN